MSYNTPATFRTNSIVSGSYDSIPDAVIQQQLNVAANRIDAACRPHHTLPFTSVPPLVVDMENTICAYKLWLMTGINPGTGTDILKEAYVEVVGNPSVPDSGILGMLAYGKMTLIASNDTDPSNDKGQPYIVGGTTSRNWHQQSDGQDVI